MNDPIIHAPISKIVEVFSTRLPLKVMEKSNVLKALENALASLGGEEPNKIDLSEVSVFELQRIMRETPIVYTAPHTTPEREVLMDDMFEALSSLENDDNSIPYNMWLNIKAICDRYLAEKGVKND